MCFIYNILADFTVLNLILASSSPFRHAVLSRLQLPFEQYSPNIDESRKKSETVEDMVLRLALEKALVVSHHRKHHFIIASDQVAVCKGSILGKPGNLEKARKQLQFQSGEEVTFYTSLILLNSQDNSYQQHLSTILVNFRVLSLTRINNYLNKEQPFNCAGSFKSESLGAALFSSIKSDDPDALLGLPLLSLVQMLSNVGMDPLDN